MDVGGVGTADSKAHKATEGFGPLPLRCAWAGRRLRVHAGATAGGWRADHGRVTVVSAGRVSQEGAFYSAYH